VIERRDQAPNTQLSSRQSYRNVEGIAWLSKDTLVAVSDKRKPGQPERCARKDQSIHVFRIPARRS